MRVSRLLPFALGAFLLWMGVLAVYIASKGDNDFDGFHRAARHLLTEGQLSEARDIERYPPTFQVLMLPLALVPVGVAAFFWYALNAACLLALPRLFERSLGIPLRAQLPAWILAGPFVPVNLQLGQSAPLLIFASAWSIERLRRSAAGSALAGFVLVLLGALKVLPLAFLGLPTLLRRIRLTWIGVALGLLACGGLLVLAVGKEEARASCQRWLEDVETQSPWNLVKSERSLRYANQGLGVTLARTFGEFESQRVRGRVELLHLPLPVVWSAYFALLALTGLLTLKIVLRARRDGDMEAWLRGYAAIALAMLIVSPIVWTHYFLWWLPAGLALRRHDRALMILAACSLLATTLPATRALGFHIFTTLGLLVAIERTQAASSRVEGRLELPQSEEPGIAR
jgi:alpha-1,2-mannosyltransferase